MISVTILSKNSERHLAKVLDALTSFDEVLLYDNGSMDKTLEIGESYPNVVIKKGSFQGFGPTHNIASALAKNDWIFSCDTDEVATPELIEEIKSLTLERKKVYSIPRRNEYRGRWIKGCGWHPDRVTRLYHRADTRFTDAQVHERILTDQVQVIDLKSPLRHFSYDDIGDFLLKMEHYSELFAKERKGKVSSSPSKAALHALYAFFKSYFLKKGFLDGYPGFVISSYNSHTAFYKYLKLYEANLQVSDGPMKTEAL